MVGSRGAGRGAGAEGSEQKGWEPALGLHTVKKMFRTPP